jgi:predicted PhzF superfamily epimerase YddE/YHI9
MIPIVWVDAFSEHPFGGNPAAICLLEGPADEQWMQALAFEFGISETAYVWPLEDGTHSLRWFTPTTEVDLCGHATLAAAHAIGDRGGSALEFSTRSGRLSARFDGDLIELDFPADPPSPIPVPDALAPLRARATARSTHFLIAELADAEAVTSLVPDLAAFAELPDRAVLVTAPGGTGDIDYVLRMFGPKVGIDEDPVTGSAQCALGPYWSPVWARRYWRRRNGRPGVAGCE